MRDDEGLERILLTALFLVALGARALLTTAPPYGDEAVHYAVSRHLWNDESNVKYPGDFSEDYSVYFWQRPVFALTFAPGALLGFEAYRMMHILVASTLPVLGALVVLRLSGSRVGALVAGAGLALHPLFVSWGARVFPDTLAAVFALAFLLAWLERRLVLAAVLGLAAAWTKEPAALVVGIAAAIELWRMLRLPRGTQTATKDVAIPVAAAASPLPLMVSLAFGARVPGWGVGGEPLAALRTMALSLPLLVFVVMGLVRPGIRIVSAAALGLVAFFVAYAGLYDRSVELWYSVLSGALVLVAATAAAARAGPRRAVVSLVVVAMLLAGSVLLPSNQRSSVVAQVAFPPASMPLREIYGFAALEGDEVMEAAAAVDALGRPRLVALDLSWGYKYYPFAEAREEALVVYSEIPGRWGPTWATVLTEAVRPDSAFLVQSISDRASPFGVFESALADCLVFRNEAFALYDASRCAAQTLDLLTYLDSGAWRDEGGTEGTPSA